jgi:hypothetical protein
MIVTDFVTRDWNYEGGNQFSIPTTTTEPDEEVIADL